MAAENRSRSDADAGLRAHLLHAECLGELLRSKGSCAPLRQKSGSQGVSNGFARGRLTVAVAPVGGISQGGKCAMFPGQMR